MEPSLIAKTRFKSILGPAYNEFGYNEYLAVIGNKQILCIRINENNAKKFHYNEQFLLHFFYSL